MTQTIVDKDVAREGQLVTGGMRALEAELSSQRAMAVQNPRKVKKVLEEALAELNLFPVLASKAYYVIPFKDYESGTTKNIEGPSVKASRALTRLWGNCATASRVMEETDDRYQVEGVFIDFETNAIFRRTVSVSKFYVPKKTKIKTPLRDDRLTTALQAGMSKAERNAALAGLPEWLKLSYDTEARRLAGGGKAAGSKDKEASITERLKAMYDKFESLKVDRKLVEGYVERELKGKTGQEIIVHMIGIFNAIDDGQVKASEVFAVPAQPGKEGVKLEDVTGEGSNEPPTDDLDFGSGK